MEGIWQYRVWLFLRVLGRTGSNPLLHHIENGSVLWDCSIARLMPVVLMASLKACSGNVTRADRYKGMEHMKWSHVNFTIDGDGGLLLHNLNDHVAIRITLDLAMNTGEIPKTCADGKPMLPRTIVRWDPTQLLAKGVEANF